jgi:hypothetical protein
MGGAASSAQASLLVMLEAPYSLVGSTWEFDEQQLDVALEG